MDTKSLEQAGFQFVGIRKGCRWACDRPSNGQASDWISFEILVVLNNNGTRLWCRNYYNKPWWGNNVFAPIPEGAGGVPDEELPEVLAFWNQDELAALEQQAK